MESEKEELNKEDLLRKEAEGELDRLQKLIFDFEEKHEDNKKGLSEFLKRLAPEITKFG